MVSTIAELTAAPARELASMLHSGVIPGAKFIGMKQSLTIGYAAIEFEVDVERPQDLAHPINATEPIAIFFAFDDRQPSVLALRDDFPDTMHQNWSPPETPCVLCIDDRPWAESKLTSTPTDMVRRVQLWLAKAASGELHDSAQPPDPLFFISQLALIIPASVLVEATEPVELVGFVRQDNPQLIITKTVQHGEKHPPGFVVLTFYAQPQSMTRLRRAPVTLATLAEQLARCGIKLYDELKTRLKTWAGIKDDSIRRLTSRLAIIIAFPVLNGGGRTANDVRAFMTTNTAGEIGVALGVLYQNASRVGAKDAYVTAIPENTQSNTHLEVQPAQVHFALDPDLAALVAGHATPDRRRAVLVGAGSLGSQVAVDLAREGIFSWTIVDDDYLLPHNLARHALFGNEIGAPKALALARQLSGLLNEQFAGLTCNVMKPDEDLRGQLTTRLSEADVIIDASASVAVSRHLADLPGASARRICTFFNPAGTAVVVLTENADRSVTLRDLEAQYHRLVLTDTHLTNHLRSELEGVRYSGSCRALTNRIPATKAALLSALAARGIIDCLKNQGASMCIWNVADNGEVRLVKRSGSAVDHMTLGSWGITYDARLLNDLATLRQSRLPNETGGVLLGIVDMSRKSIHVAYAMPEPEDSHGTRGGFERGVADLLGEVNRAVEASMHQLRYVGEWHSHPNFSSYLPSAIDLAQLTWLGSELAGEGLPGLMAIAAEDGRFAFVFNNQNTEWSADANSELPRSNFTQ